MKTVTRETNSFGMFLEFVWACTMIFGTAYLVFWKGHSGWWFLLAILLASASISTKKVETESV